jgi:hypothetical protein
VREKDLARKLSELLRMEEIMAKQRSRVDWLKEGDRNTSFFHARSSVRRSQNRIRVLTDENGVVLEEKEHINANIRGFYTELYEARDNINVQVVLNSVLVKVTNMMNSRLCRPFEENEVEKALFDMKPSKAPRVDGFTASFFQKHCQLVKDDVSGVVLAFLQGGHMPEIVNKTIIIMIPKVKNPQNITQYRRYLYAMCYIKYIQRY